MIVSCFCFGDDGVNCRFPLNSSHGISNNRRCREVYMKTKRRLWAFARAFIHFAKFLFYLFIFLLVGFSLLENISKSPTLFSESSFFALLMLLILVEYVARKLLPRYYFKFGLPILRRDYSVFSMENMSANFVSLPRKVNKKELLPQIDIYPLSDYEYGLWATSQPSKDKPFWKRGRKYNPLARGYLVLDREKYLLKLRVYVNWFTIPFLFLWFGGFIRSLSTNFLFGLFLIVFGVFVFTQLYQNEIIQYLKVWDAVQRHISGEYGIEQLEREFLGETES